MASMRIGTVDLPERVERSRYFHELSYLELSVLFAGPVKPAVLGKWAEVAPAGTLGLVAPWVLTHRKPPKAAQLWTHDASVGDFRDSAPGREALEHLRGACTTLKPAYVLFRSPPLHAPSAANREQLLRFFSEVATESSVGAPRVWVPDGLWEPRHAVAFANQLGVCCALDPLVRDPNTPAEVYEDLEAPALYFRIAGLGRAGPIRTEQQEDLAVLAEHYETLALTFAFDSTKRWQDARNLKKRIEDALPGPSEASEDPSET